MELTNRECEVALELAAESTQSMPVELSDLQLSLIGGGMGDVIND